jgi:hypothetical protein
MEQEIVLRILLQKPPSGVDYALQKGNGHNYETFLKQRSKGQDLTFEFTARVKAGKQNIPTLGGPFIQGPAGNKFVYINIGASARQTDSQWNRRLKVPLTGITEEMMHHLSADTTNILETKVAGTAKDGSPTCATVKPFDGWKIVKR